MMIWPYRTMFFNFKTSFKCSYMYTMYLTQSHPSFPLSSSLIALTNLPLPVMSSCFYNPLDSVSVTHMHVSVEGRSWLPAPQPQDQLSLPWQSWTTNKSSARGGTRSLPSFHGGGFNWLDLVKSSVQVSWCPVQRTAFHSPAPILTVILFPLPLQHGSLSLEDTELQHVLLTTQSLTLSTFYSYVYLHQPVPDTVRRFFDYN